MRSFPKTWRSPVPCILYVYDRLGWRLYDHHQWRYASQKPPVTAIIRQIQGRIWWRYGMETLSTILAPCDGESTCDQWGGQWCGALIFSLLSVWTSCWTNSRIASDLRHMLIWRHCNRLGQNSAFGKNRRQTNNFSITSDGAGRGNLSRATKEHDKQRVLMHGHQGWNVRHGLCHIYMRYVYIYELFIAFVSFVVCSLL